METMWNLWTLWKLECGMWIKTLFFFLYVWIWTWIWIYFILLLIPFLCVLVFVFDSVCGFMPSPVWFRAVFVRAVGNTGYGM